MALIGGVRTGVPGPIDDLVRALPDDRVERIAVGPLSLGAIGRIVELRTARARGRALLARLTDAAGGNPLLALELVRAIDAGDVQPTPGHPLGIPASAEPLIAERLGRLPLAAHEAVLAVALAAGPTIDALRAALGRAALDPGLEEALRAGLLELDGTVVRLSHPLVGAAAVGLATPDRLRETHARLAGVTLSPEARARHMALSVDWPDEDSAAACDAAADEAERRGAPEAAAELVELAIGVTDPDDRARLAARCRHAAALRVAIGDPERARRHIDAGLAVADGPADAVPLLLVAAELAHHVAGRPAARVAAAAALDAAGGDPILQARAHGAMVAWGTEGTAEERRHATAVLDLLAGDEDAAPEAAADALAILADSQLASGGGPAFDLLERAMALDRLRSDLVIGSLQILAGNLATADRIDESRARWKESMDRLERAGYESRRAAVLTHTAWMEFRAGDLLRTGELLDAADALSRDLGADTTGPRLYRAHLDAMLGDRRAVREAAAIGLQEAHDAGNAWVVALWRRAIGIDALLGGEPDAAADHLRAALDTALALGLLEPNWARMDADLVEALVGGRRYAEADEALAAFGARMATARLPWSVVAHARATAVLWIARHDADGALRVLDGVAADAADLPLVVERGRFDLVRGIALRRLRRVREARTALERACAAFDAAPTPPLSARARSELARLGGRPAAGHELTSAERRVAELAAAGRSNREIADELVVSVRTVESQLSAVYVKLGVRGRAALGPALAREAVPSE